MCQDLHYQLSPHGKNKGLDDLVLDFVVAVPEGTKSLEFSSFRFSDQQDLEPFQVAGEELLLVSGPHSV